MRLHTALVLAIHAPLSLSKESKAGIEPRASVNDCGDASFENQSSPGSPLISDCEVIIENIKDGGTWTIFGRSYRQLVQYGTCAFDVDQVPSEGANVGNADIIDLIRASIAMYGWEGRVGAKGKMGCLKPATNIEDWVNITWSIFRNPGHAQDHGEGGEGGE
ncbi:putative necrosis-inducing factor-domain-containing protein [Hypoxylon sp. NC1633]|nr:putative necrosis-inducing factor-domain-containing protein [Hypoxylon sp. NC1633]